jgi:glucose/arabinose dehydrogenase
MRKTVLLFVLGLVLSSLLFGGNVQDIPGYDAEPILVDGVFGVTPVAETIASGLTIPWGLAFAPDGRLFVTERPGRVRVIDNTGLRAQPVINMASVVAATGEGGLCGIAVDPDFPNNGYLYVYHTYRSGGGLANRVVRLVVNGSTATIDRVIVDGIPGGTVHDGGRIKIGPDGLLYIGTGEGGTPTRAQDLGSLGGKILRVNLDGSAPDDNPFPDTAPLVYSYGHRNVQGFDWDASGQMYATEHGPTGEFGRQANDEVNIIYPGLNYGWPNCIGICGDPNYMDPIKLFTPQAVPPGGAAFYYGDALPMWYGSFFFGTLGFSSTGPARHLHRLLFDDLGGTAIVDEQVIARNQFGRIRDVVAGPDGYLYFTTSNRDGRGTPAASDDRVIRIRPQ